MALSTNLVSYWKLDESSGNAADSVGSNTLTNNGSAVYAAGKINNAVTCVRNTDYLSIANGSQTGLNPTGSFTINTWVKWSSIDSGNWNGIVSKLDNTSRAYGSGILKQGGTDQYWVAVDIGTSGGSSYSTPNANYATLVTGTWYMITIRYSTAGTVKVDINNSRLYTDTGAPSSCQAGTADFRIGYRNNPSPDDGSNALFDETGFWDREISDAEVTELYNGGAGLAYPFASASAQPAIFMGCNF